MTKSPPKLPKGVHLVECSVGRLPNWLPFFSGKRSVLIDTGLKADPKQVILPALRKFGVEPDQLALMINSHADIDHNGGNASLLERCPQVRLASGEADRPLIESTQALWEARWQLLQADHGLAYDETNKGGLGPGTRVDWVVKDGDVLALDGGRTLEAVAAPGHSFGHLAFLLRPERILFCGDSVQGDGLLSTPQYIHPDIYLDTLSRLARVRPTMVVTCHLGVFRGAAIHKLLQSSRDVVTQVDRLLRRALRANGNGQTLAELNYTVSRGLGLWNEASDLDFSFTLHGHLSRATQRGWARQAGPERPLRFVES